MFTNLTTPTPYYPFDCTSTRATIAVGSAIRDSTGASIVGGTPAPFLTPQQAFELRYNVKGMLMNVPSYEYNDSSLGGNVYISPSGNVIITRYTVNSSVLNNVRFVSTTNIPNLATTFFIDLSLGATWIPNNSYIGWSSRAWFAPVTKFYGVGNTTDGGQIFLVGGIGGSPINFSYWGYGGYQNAGFTSDGIALASIPVGLVSFVGNNTAPVFLSANQITVGGIVCTERFDDIYFSPSSIDPTVDNTIIITCPASGFAVEKGFDTTAHRLGFKNAKTVHLQGLTKPIPLKTVQIPANAASFTITKSQVGDNAVLDRITVTLPKDSGVAAGRIGITTVGSDANINNTTDYFETYPKLFVD